VEADAPDKVVMRWTIQPDGKTRDISTQTEAYANSTMAQCLEKQIGEWKFPKHRTEGDPVSFPFKVGK